MFHHDFEGQPHGRSYPAEALLMTRDRGNAGKGFAVALGGCFAGVAVAIAAFAVGAGLWLSLLVYFLAAPAMTLLIGLAMHARVTSARQPVLAPVPSAARRPDPRGNQPR